MAITGATESVRSAEAQQTLAADGDPIHPPWTRQLWAEVGKLPDWSGTWTPDITDQVAQEKGNPPPWNEKAGKMVAFQDAEAKAGRPHLVFSYCVPESMPSWMLISHNSLEFLFTPGRVTMLGESDSNRLRRVYTDGRPHPEDPDLTFHGHSIGHWEGDGLVIDTVGILPQVYIASSEAHGVPNNGDMHIKERIYLENPDTMHVEMEITAPHVLTKPWKSTRIYYRQRKQKFDIVEGICIEANLNETVDKDGNHIYEWINFRKDGSVNPDANPDAAPSTGK